MALGGRGGIMTIYGYVPARSMALPEMCTVVKTAYHRARESAFAALYG